MQCCAVALQTLLTACCRCHCCHICSCCRTWHNMNGRCSSSVPKIPWKIPPLCPHHGRRWPSRCAQSTRFSTILWRRPAFRAALAAAGEVDACVDFSAFFAVQHCSTAPLQLLPLTQPYIGQTSLLKAWDFPCWAATSCVCLCVCVCACVCESRPMFQTWWSSSRARLATTSSSAPTPPTCACPPTFR